MRILMTTTQAEKEKFNCIWWDDRRLYDKEKMSSHTQRLIYLMQKTKHFTSVYHKVLLFCPKRCQIEFYTLFDYENQQQPRITKYCD